MEKTGAIINNIYSESNEYVRLQIKSVKLEIYERVTNLIDSGISAALILLFGLFSFLFINFGLAFWIGELFNSTKIGFFLIGLFYFVALGLYLALKNKVAKNKVRNIVLLKVSKTHNDYDLLLKEQKIVSAEVQKSETTIRDNFNELKENMETLKNDLNKIKEHFVTGAGDEHSEERVGPKIPRLAVTSIVDLLIQKVFLRKAGLMKKTLVPIITNALLTSSLFKETKKTSLIENLKLKLSKFL